MINANVFRRVSVGFLIFALLLGFGLIAVSQAFGEEGGRKIVVWEKGVNPHSRALSGKIKDLDLVNASVVLVSSKSEEKALRSLPGVARVEDDALVTTLGKPAGSQPAQVLPWGVDRVDADLVWPTGNSADPVKVAVVDTGISNSHPDLSANLKGGVNFVLQKGRTNPSAWNDDNGHGSHVAGIIAAANNSVGVIGVAHSADLYAVKVLDRNGSGYLSDVISGIEWAMNNGMQVVNMSLGSSSDLQSMHDAVTAARNAGVTLVVAAGNSGGAVSYPGAYPEVVAVSATDSNNLLASFSSRGPEVDLAAPGVNIYSTYKGTGYATLSGTSMATPHVTGAAALILNTPAGTYDINGNGKWDPAEVQQKLQDRATDLGAAGFDNLYGWGLVNAFTATQ